MDIGRGNFERRLGRIADDTQCGDSRGGVRCDFELFPTVSPHERSSIASYDETTDIRLHVTRSKLPPDVQTELIQETGMDSVCEGGDLFSYHENGITHIVCNDVDDMNSEQFLDALAGIQQRT